MTPDALRLLHECAKRTIIMRSTDAQWESAQILIDAEFARIDWTMRGRYAGLAITDQGRAVLKVQEDKMSGIQTQQHKDLP